MRLDLSFCRTWGLSKKIVVLCHFESFGLNGSKWHPWLLDSSGSCVYSICIWFFIVCMILYSRVQFMCIHAPYISIFIFLYPSYMSMLPWHSSGIWIFDSSRRSIPKSLSSDSVITVLGSQVRRLHISAQGSQYGCLMMFRETWEKHGKTPGKTTYPHPALKS